MNITEKIIVTDTNIITDLHIAGVLKKYSALNNVFISDLVKNDEINFKTCNIETIEDMKTISSSANELLEANLLSIQQPKLTTHDIINFILARDNNYILATGDKDLKVFSESKNVEVIRTLKIIELMCIHGVITYSEALNGLYSLKKYPKTRIPIQLIDDMIDKIKNSANMC